MRGLLVLSKQFYRACAYRANGSRSVVSVNENVPREEYLRVVRSASAAFCAGGV